MVSPRRALSFGYQRLDGKSRMAMAAENGTLHCRRNKALFSHGDFLGEDCLAGRSFRMSTATPLTECSILRLEKARGRV
jgi:CRP-like cAMP-binding protein